MRLPSLMIAMLAPALVLTACNREPAEQEGEIETQVESVRVSGVTLGRGVDASNQITDETLTFRPTDTIYASVRTEGSASGTLAARWTFEDGQVVDETSRTVSGGEVTEFHVSKPDGWPAGRYDLVITLDGSEVDRKSFTVEGV